MFLFSYLCQVSDPSRFFPFLKFVMDLFSVLSSFVSGFSYPSKQIWANSFNWSLTWRTRHHTKIKNFSSDTEDSNRNWQIKKLCQDSSATFQTRNSEWSFFKSSVLRLSFFKSGYSLSWGLGDQWNSEHRSMRLEIKPTVLLNVWADHGKFCQQL